MVSALVVVSFLAGLFMAWIIGGTGASPAFGPVNSARAVNIFQGALVVGVAAFLGAVTQGGAVADTMRGGLVDGVTFDPLLASIVLLISATLILVSVITQYPLPTVFTVVGAVMGAAYAAGGSANMDMLSTIMFFWLVIPFVAAGIGYTTATLLRRYVPKTEQSKTYINAMLFIVATYTAYTAGANQVGLAVGPLQNVVEAPVLYFLLFGGIGMMVGAWTGSPRLIEAIARDYSKMGPRRAIAALLAASVLAQVATRYGVPVSFNQAILASIVGSGLVVGRGEIGTRKIVITVAAWVATLGLATGLSYAVTWLAV